jgi:hypothetical protein
VVVVDRLVGRLFSDGAIRSLVLFFFFYNNNNNNNRVNNQNTLVTSVRFGYWR